MTETPTHPMWAAALFEAAPDGIVVVDRSGTIVAANAQADEVFGADPGALVGRSVDDLVPHALRQRHRTHRAQYVADPRQRRMGIGLELSALRDDGLRIPVDIALSFVEVGEETYVIASVRDMREALEAEEELLRARERVSILEDRQRIARDLHDTVIQDIFAAGMGLQALQPRLADPELREGLSQSVEHLDQVIQRLRKVIFDLGHPRETEPLEQAVARVIDETTVSAPVTVKTEVHSNRKALPARVEEHLLSTLREALTNVVKHADAREVLIKIDVADRLILEVTDDGTGLDNGGPGSGFGIGNMITRASTLGGECTIVPGTNGGTTVAWVVPLSG